MVGVDFPEHLYVHRLGDHDLRAFVYYIYHSAVNNYFVLGCQCDVFACLFAQVLLGAFFQSSVSVELAGLHLHSEDIEVRYSC